MTGRRLTELVEELRVETHADRTTLRLEDAPDGAFAIVAESRADGVPALRGGSVGDLRTAPTFRHLQRERRPLVQDDLAGADPAPPPDLVRAYGVRAQMLAPLVDGDRLVGIVSVHSGAPRRWSGQDVAALEAAAEAIQRLLRRGAGDAT